jgi:hypothetical protein
MSGGLTNPQGWNRYSYVANDPVNFTTRMVCGRNRHLRRAFALRVTAMPIASGTEFSAREAGWGERGTGAGQRQITFRSSRCRIIAGH